MRCWYVIPPSQLQYEFLYTAILEALMCRDTSIQGHKLREKLYQLQNTDPSMGKTFFDLQFEVQ